MPGQIRPASQIRPGMKYCSIWVEIHGFTPNSTGHEILLKLGIISMDLLPFEQYFMPGRIRPAGRIRPGMKYCSIWVEIHGFTPNLTGHEILLKMGVNSLR